MEGYFPLAENYVTQAHPAFCGLGSLTMVYRNTLYNFLLFIAVEKSDF